ncbi:hypothetical protein [Pseudonocardia oroxyli]|uniref:Uncharacterized protein n=1 Tax=Pseudonocardia oroxyli TaxID=366584 RepID=A0A1G8EH71_PSEOR|nr:hypothetical protein [Pseudonocardia oroxyli]SDH69265.1 hypothetical protein SAMN05216377_1363 [Pseudonocardia oroxyli]
MAAGKPRQGPVGFTKAVADLRDTSKEELCIGYVDDRPSGGLKFQVFLTPALDELVACLGVEKIVRD